MNTLLVVDVGNTSTSVGLFSNGRVSRVGRIDSARSRTTAASDLVKACAGRFRPVGGVIASVVPTLEPVWEKLLRPHVTGRILTVQYGLQLGVPVTYPRPATIGADRLANACGAAWKYKTPLIVADFGTAVTFDVVVPRRGYIGGVIAPGLPLMFSYLSEKTAKLPAIQPGPIRHPVGKSTEEAMRMGALHGYRGMVKEIVQQLVTANRLRNPALIATGGYAGWVVRGLKPAMTVDQHLTLVGSGRIYGLNA